MPTSRRRALLPLIAAAALPLAAPAARAAGAPGPLKAVFQVSDADPHKWALALNNLRNVSDDLGGDMAVELELVVYGPGIGMLKAGSPVAERVAEAQKNGVKVVACENTMKAQKLTYADMLPKLGYVPAGVVELIKKQHAGWAYIRP
ncbi:MAG: DsrE family protein [Betaproteobacteria bacterium]|nr:DsrE family protein [Betaproteobacteria bacterium]